MFRLAGQINVDTVDVRAFVATLPALLTSWRQLRFDEGRGRHPASGQRWEGIQVISGTHPYPGTVYRLVFQRESAPQPTSPEPFEGREPPETTHHVVLVELRADEYSRTSFSVREDAGSGWAEVEIERPDLPGAVDLVIELPGPADRIWLARGRVVSQVRITTDRLLPAEGPEPQLVARLTHPRARARVETRLAAAGRGAWTLTMQIEAGGRGLLRPVVWLLTPFLRSHAQRWLDAFLARLPEHVTQLNRELAAEFGGSPDPQLWAAGVLEDLFDALARSLPPELHRGSPAHMSPTPRT
jgi:hypothetical protein